MLIILQSCHCFFVLNVYGMYFVSVVSITSVGKHQIYLTNTKKGEKRYLWVDFSDGLKKAHYFLSKFTTTPTVYQAHGTGPVEGPKIIIINIRILDPLNTLKKIRSFCGSCWPGFERKSSPALSKRWPCTVAWNSLMSGPKGISWHLLCCWGLQIVISWGRLVSRLCADSCIIVHKIDGSKLQRRNRERHMHEWKWGQNAICVFQK